MSRITRVSGPAVVLDGHDIDTDRIVPARFLKELSFDNMGERLMWDERFTQDGSTRPHPLNEADGARVLVTGRNFGCGSSREHAPQALRRFGIEAIVAESFAEIFAGNALGLGIVCATVAGEHAEAIREAAGTSEVTVDVEGLTVSCGGQNWPITMPGSSREALIEGRWDTLAELMEGAAEAKAVWRRLPYTTR